MDPRGNLRADAARADACVLAANRDGGALPEGCRSLATENDLDLYLARQFLPWRGEDGRTVIATADSSAENLAWLAAAYGQPRIVPVASGELRRAVSLRFAARLSDDAVYSLSRKFPALSAHRTITARQGAAFAAVGLVMAMACWAWPSAIAQGLVVAMSVGFALSASFRAGVALFGSHRRAPRPGAPAELADGTLPLYTVLVPLFQEAKVLPDLARALLALDYPGIMQQAHLWRGWSPCLGHYLQ